VCDPAQAVAVLDGISDSFDGWSAARVVAADALERGVPLVLQARRPIRSSVRLPKLAVSPDERYVVMPTEGGTVLHAWDLTTGAWVGVEVGRVASGDIVYAPDGRMVIADAMGDGIEVRAPDRTLLAKVPGPQLTELAIDGDELVARSMNGAVRGPLLGPLTPIAFEHVVWRRATHELVGSRDRAILLGDREIATLPEPPNWLAVTPDGAALVALTSARPYAIELTTGVVRPIGEPSRWDRDAGRALANEYFVYANDDRLEVVKLATGTLIEVDLGGHVSTVEASHDGTRFAASTHRGRVVVFDPARPRMLRELVGHTSAVGALAFLGDHSLISASSDSTLRIWPLPPERGPSAAFAGLADGGWLQRTGNELVLHAVDGTTHSLIGSLDEDDRWFMTVPGYFAGNDASHQGRVWDSRSGDVVIVQPARALALSATTAAISDDRVITVWDLSRRQPIAKLETTSSVNVLAFDPDGKRIAIGEENGSASIWTIADGVRGVAPVTKQSTTIMSLAWSPDGAQLAVAPFDPLIVLYRGGQISQMARPGLCRAIKFSHSGAKLASCCGMTGVQVRDVASGRDDGYTGMPIACGALDWSPDDSRLVTNQYDGDARIWDVSSGEGRALEANLAAVQNPLHWTPDGTAVIAAGRRFEDALPLDPAKLRAAIRDIVHTKVRRAP
jgi:eukaryotic-like serine/threonine-protein kinase